MSQPYKPVTCDYAMWNSVCMCCDYQVINQLLALGKLLNTGYTIFAYEYWALKLSMLKECFLEVTSKEYFIF